MSLSFEGGSLGQPSALPDVASFPDILLDKAYVSLAAWPGGMILASGARGPGFNSRSSPFLFSAVALCNGKFIFLNTRSIIVNSTMNCKLLND